MSKKNKEEKITYESQQAALDAIDRLVFENNDSLVKEAIIEEDIEDHGEHFFADQLFNAVKRKRGMVEIEEPPTDEECENESDSSIDPTFREFRIEYRKGDFNIISFSDGIKSMSIDLNSLGYDGVELPNNEYLTPLSIALIRLREIIPDFYPGMIKSESLLNQDLKNLHELDEEAFQFFEYPTEDNNLILGYYVSDESLRNYTEAVKELMQRNQLASFLEMLFDTAGSEGFSFRCLRRTFISELSLTEDISNSNKGFISRIHSDELTVEDVEFENGTIRNLVSLLPYDFFNDEIDNIISPEDDEEGSEISEEVEEEYEDDEDDFDADEEDTQVSYEREEDRKDTTDNLEDELSVGLENELDNMDNHIEAEETDGEEDDESEIEENSIQVNVKSYVGVEIETAPTESASETDDIEEENNESDEDEGLSSLLDDLDEDPVPDPDEMEREYYSSKGKKPPVNKTQKKKPDDDDKWTIKRR